MTAYCTLRLTKAHRAGSADVTAAELAVIKRHIAGDKNWRRQSPKSWVRVTDDVLEITHPFGEPAPADEKAACWRFIYLEELLEGLGILKFDYPGAAEDVRQLDPHPSGWAHAQLRAIRRGREWSERVHATVGV